MKLLKYNQKGKFRAVIKQILGHSGAPCLGYWSIYHPEDGALRPVHIPDLELDTDLGDGAEVEIEWTFRVVKKGKKPTRKCMNPWPAHSHDKGR